MDAVWMFAGRPCTSTYPSASIFGSWPPAASCAGWYCIDIVYRVTPKLTPVCLIADIFKTPKSVCSLSVTLTTRSSAAAERPRDASCY